MRWLAFVLSFLVAAYCGAQENNHVSAKPGGISRSQQSIQAGKKEKSSGPLAWVASDVNTKTVFYIQGRFVPVGDSKFQGDAEVVTILCSIREYMCFEIDGTNPFENSEEVWIDEYKPISWENSQIVATSQSLDGCTDYTLKIKFTPPSVVKVFSPVLPMPEHCKKINDTWDKLAGKQGHTITLQMEQYTLVPTRGVFSFQDVKPETPEDSMPAQSK